MDLDQILGLLLGGEPDQHHVDHVDLGRRGYMKKDLDEIMADEHGELHDFAAIHADQRLVVAPPPQAPMAALTADEKDLALWLAVGSAVGLPRQIERETLNTGTPPASVDTGLVLSMDLVGNGTARTGGEEHLVLLPDLGAAIGLPQQIEREALNSVVRPAIVDTGLVPTMDLVVNGTALTGDEEHLTLLLDLAAVIGLPQQIDREALNSVVRPAIVDTGLVPTMDLVGNGTALTADEEHLALLLDLGAVIGLPQQIEREALNSVVRPEIVDTGLVPTMALVDNGAGSGPTLTPTLEVHVAWQTKQMQTKQIGVLQKPIG